MLSLSRKALVDALRLVAKAVPGRPVHAILGGIHISGGAGICRLHATDMTTHLVLSLPCTGDMAPVVVPAKALAAAIKSMAGPMVDLDKGLDKLAVSCGHTVHIPDMDAACFPPAPTGDTIPISTVDAPRLALALDRVSYAASKEMSRYAINGVYFWGHGGRLSLVATDGHRMAETNGLKSNVDCEIVYPRKALEELQAILKGRADPVAIKSMHATHRYFDLSGPGWQLIVQAEEGSFPPYEQVIPSHCDDVFNLPKAALVDALKALSGIPAPVGEKEPAVKFTPEGESMIASRGETAIPLPMTWTRRASNSPVKFRIEYLQDFMAVWDRDTVDMGLNTKTADSGLRIGPMALLNGPFMAVLMPTE